VRNGSGTPTGAEFRRITRARLERIRRLKFDVAAWVLGMIVLASLWALIEWQDKGGFERWSNNGYPGDWEPWVLYGGGVWAHVIAILALQMYCNRSGAATPIRGPTPDLAGAGSDFRTDAVMESGRHRTDRRGCEAVQVVVELREGLLDPHVVGVIAEIGSDLLAVDEVAVRRDGRKVRRRRCRPGIVNREHGRRRCP
jgi:hypothetical protein